MADAEFIRHSARGAVRPPSTQDPVLRAGWGSQGAGERPARLTQHAQTGDSEADVGALGAALGGIALVLIATAAIVIVFAF